MELNLISLKVEEEQFNHCSGLKALFFYTVHEVLTASILGWFAIHSSSRLTGKSLMLGKIEHRRRRGLQRMRCLDGISDAMDMNLGKLWLGNDERQGGLACCSPWGHKKLDMTRWLNNSSKRFCSVPKRIFLTLKLLKYKWVVWRRLLWCSRKIS